MSTPADIGYELRCASRLVGAVFDLPPETFTGPRKGPPVYVHARQVLCYVLHTEAALDQVQIARALGRHRSTIGHAVDVVTALRDTDEIDRALTDIGDMYRKLRDAREAIPMIEELAP